MARIGSERRNPSKIVHPARPMSSIIHHCHKNMDSVNLSKRISVYRLSDIKGGFKKFIDEVCLTICTSFGKVKWKRTFWAITRIVKSVRFTGAKIKVFMMELNAIKKKRGTLPSLAGEKESK